MQFVAVVACGVLALEQAAVDEQGAVRGDLQAVAAAGNAGPAAVVGDAIQWQLFDLKCFCQRCAHRYACLLSIRQRFLDAGAREVEQVIAPAHWASRARQRR